MIEALLRRWATARHSCVASRRPGSSGIDPLHRWIRGRDLVTLLLILQRMRARRTIEAFFLKGDDASQKTSVWP
jgi:hypothetical protein